MHVWKYCSSENNIQACNFVQTNNLIDSNFINQTSFKTDFLRNQIKLWQIHIFLNMYFSKYEN